MSKVINPRFPHHCSIVRYASTGPMKDQSNILEDNPLADDPIGDDDLWKSDKSYQIEGGNDKTNLPICTTTIYNGKCRSDNRDTISDNGEVIASYRTLALPLKQDEWTEENIPREGDRVELQRIGYKEYGLVIDIRPSNLGTHILWKYVRN